MRGCLFFMILLVSTSLMAQIDSPLTPQIDIPASSGTDSNGFQILRDDNSSLNFPRKTPSKQSTLGREDEKPFSMIDDEFQEYNSNITPKYFSQDKDIKPEYGKDMYLGDFKTKAETVSILYRDHEYVDGDRVRVYVNGDVVVANEMLVGQFRGLDIPLQDGFNRIEFEALNQGTSGPNTAQLQIRDEAGNVLANYEWNLLTGRKATAIIVKQ